MLNGSPGYINLLDALSAWQLVRELKRATSLPSAASFKHVSPAGTGTAVPLSEALVGSYRVKSMELSPLATAYARARGADRMSSFGDFAALSDVVDVPTAKLLQREMSDGVIAPGYLPEALELLRTKHGGRYLVLDVDDEFQPDALENRDLFGVTFAQPRNSVAIEAEHLAHVVTKVETLTPEAQRDLLVAMITLKYTQSNSVCFAKDGQAIGVGAGQQSRIHCTRLAGDKADTWWLRQHPRALDLPFREGLKRWDRDNGVDAFLRSDLSPAENREWQALFTEVPERLSETERREWLDQLGDVSLASDGFFPFRDNIDRAARSGVRYVAQPGGSLRDDAVIAAADEYGMAMAFTRLRLFHH